MPRFGAFPADHKARHQDGGPDEINVANLSGDLADPQDPKGHHTTHEPGGSDEVTGVSPGAHAASHQNGGADEVNIAGLSGEPAELTTHKNATTGVHGVGASTVDSVANRNAAISAHAGNASAHHTKTGDNEVYGLLAQGLVSARPAAGIDGRLYYATDEGILYRDTGAAWEEKARAETSIRLAQLSERAHSSLTGIGANDHHAQLHAASHQAGGGDQLFNQNLNTSDSPSFAQVTIGDLVMKNGWRLTEHDEYGVVFQSPEGKVYRVELIEC
ncbi:MAG: hypothetical protein JRC53_03960 [Deltaproteobacteria bacterium]|nr:hypothetical protein [Deltaproteobacteria bacterium]